LTTLTSICPQPGRYGYDGAAWGASPTECIEFTLLREKPFHLQAMLTVF
jgi:hypothetical protein